MRKKSRVIVALVTILALCLVATGCSCSKSNDKSNTTTNDTSNTTITDNSTRSTDNTANNLVGSWKHEKENENDTDNFYTYNADGTGNFKVITSWQELNFNFTYKATNDTITQTMDGETWEIKYVINGDEMTTENDGSVIHYTKVK